MGGFGAARQLQRSEWYWLSQQARLPRTLPRASPPPVRFLPPFPPRTCWHLTSAAWLTACSHPTGSPRRVLRGRVPPRSPPPPGSLTIRSRAVPRSNLRRSPAPPGPWRLRFPLPPPRERPSRQRLRFPARRPPSRSPPANPSPAKPRLPRQRRRRPRRRRTRPRRPRPQPVAPQRRRPGPVPGAPRWKQRRRVSLSDLRRCSAWASASLYCPWPPALSSCACAGPDSTDDPCRARRTGTLTPRQM